MDTNPQDPMRWAVRGARVRSVAMDVYRFFVNMKQRLKQAYAKIHRIRRGRHHLTIPIGQNRLSPLETRLLSTGLALVTIYVLMRMDAHAHEQSDSIAIDTSSRAELVSSHAPEAQTRSVQPSRDLIAVH